MTSASIVVQDSINQVQWQHEKKISAAAPRYSHLQEYIKVSTLALFYSVRFLCIDIANGTEQDMSLLQFSSNSSAFGSEEQIRNREIDFSLT